MKHRIAAHLALLALAAIATAQDNSVIREILIKGNQRVSQQAIEAAMSTKVGQPYLQSKLDADKQSIEALGFFSAVDVRGIPQDAGNWQIVVEVVEFPEVKEIRVTGNTVIKTEDILKAILVKPGQVFNLTALRPSTEAIRQLYTRKGYIVDVEDFSPMADSPGTINLALLETKVNSVSVVGNTRTRESVMKKLIKTRAGEPLSISKWSNDLRRMYNTQWFETVQSREEQVDLGKVDLTAQVKETRTGIFNVGIQLDPRNALAGLIKLQETNFRGSGQSVGIDLQQSTGGGGPSLELSYANPFIDNRDTTLRVSLYSKVVYRFAGVLFGSNNNPTEDQRYRERRTGFSVGLGRFNDGGFAFGSNLRFENVNTEDLKIPRDSQGNPEKYIQQDGDLVVLSLTATNNLRDTDIDPSRGSWTQLSVEPGYSAIREAGNVGQSKGSSGFVRVGGEYRIYWSDQPPRGRELDAPRRVLAFRVRGGTIFGEVPFFEQYFSGGSDTVRGYAEDRFWGKSTLIANLEYRYPIQKAFNIVGFVDYGGAWGGYPSVNDYTQSDSLSLKLGYGLGLSFRTPFGNLRLDIGFDDRGKSRTHFLIGTSF